MDQKTINIALVGNPNAGKTTLFNKLTGNHQHIGNWPGVTIEKKDGFVRGRPDLVVQDLPGIYSLSPYSPEEEISRTYLLRERPDVILNIVDSSLLERNLYLTTQLLDLNIPVVVALNFIDVSRRDGDIIDVQKLQARLGCSVIEMSALKGEGIDACVERCVLASRGEDPNYRPEEARAPFSQPVEDALLKIDAVTKKLARDGRRWTAIKAFERDEKALQALTIPPDAREEIEAIIARCEEERGDDSEGIITAERYKVITSMIRETVSRGKREDHLTRSDRADQILTHRFWAYPIFILIMVGVYHVAITLGLETQNIVDHWFGTSLASRAAEGLRNLGVVDWLIGLISDGIIAGVGSVLSFVPQLMIMFFLLAIFEDVGYMARVAFIFDRVFRRFGLSGRSFIPLMVASGCSVPGIMASRTVESERDRRMTIINTPMIPCSAKLPLIALVAGAVFKGAWWVAPLMYLMGIAAVILSAVILKKTKRFAGDPAPFVMELPPYRFPSVENVLRSTWERSWSFVKRAGTVILLSSILLWFSLHFAFVDGRPVMIGDDLIAESIAAKIGGVIGILFIPLGFGGWQPAIATLAGLVAKEEVISTFGIIFRIQNTLPLVGSSDFAGIAAITDHFTQLSAFSFMLYNLFSPPCVAALSAIRSEMNSARWTWFTIGYLFLFGYTTSLIVYQIGLFATTGHFTVYTFAAFAMLLLVLYLLLRKPKTQGAAAARNGAAEA